MKNLILSAAFSILCCFVFAQTPKQVNPKRQSTDSASKIPLKQEKVWPVNDGRSKNTNILIVNPPPAVITWKKL